MIWEEMREGESCSREGRDVDVDLEVNHIQLTVDPKMWDKSKNG